jgi:hypothetical protein
VITSLHWYDWTGLVGVGMTLFAFFLLQDGRIRGDGLTYQLMNALGAFAVVLSLLYAFNLSAFVLEALWFAISVYGIARGRRLRRAR